MWWLGCSLLLCAGCLSDGLDIPEDGTQGGDLASRRDLSDDALDLADSVGELSGWDGLSPPDSGPPYCAPGERCLPFSVSHCVCPPDTYCSIGGGCRKAVCGDGDCAPVERCDTCAADCGCHPGAFCDQGACVVDQSDGICSVELGEDCTSPDCPCAGSCDPLCAGHDTGCDPKRWACVGDGACGPSEDCFNSPDCPCATGCVSIPGQFGEHVWCENGQCDGYEDCGSSDECACASGHTCVGDKDQRMSCSDGVCGGSEDCGNSIDCACPVGQACHAGVDFGGRICY